jgi:hypothetical protein
MTTRITCTVLARGLVVLALVMGAPIAALAALDGSDHHPHFPSILRVNVPQRVIVGGGGPDGRKSEIKSVTRLDGRLVLHGGENGRGWAATVAEDTGRMSAGIVTDTFAFNLFGACASP